MEGKFVGFQILERDEERGQIYPYPATSEDVATQLRTMGWRCTEPGTIELADLQGDVHAFVDIRDEAADWPSGYIDKLKAAKARG